MHGKIWAAGLMSAFAVCGVARAAEVQDCNGAESPTNIVEPWDKNTRTFYKGEVRVALIDTGGEPACCSAQLLVIAPDPNDESGERSCHLVVNKGGVGFGDIQFDKLTASYDAKKGLLIAFPYSETGLDGKTKAVGTAHVRVNVSNGKVTAE